MSLWRRAPRSVYRVYEEEQYLAGEGEPPVEDLPAAEDREAIAALSRGSRYGRLLPLGLLAAVTASATGIAAMAIMRRPYKAPVPAVAHRDRAHPTRPAASALPMPVSRARPGSIARAVKTVSLISPPVAAGPAAHRFAVVSPGPIGMGGRSAVYAPTSPIQPAAGAADMATWHTSELSATNESHADNEFGFEL
jgi:hypothetical protein